MAKGAGLVKPWYALPRLPMGSAAWVGCSATHFLGYEKPAKACGARV